MKTTRVKGWLYLAAAVLGLGGAPCQVEAQAAPGAHEHSAFAAGVIEWLVPTAGYAYAGDWTAGFLSNGVRIGSYIGLAATYDDRTDDCDDACAVWAVGALGGTIWAIVGAVHTANEHNRAVRGESSGLVVGPSPVGGVAIGFRLRR